MPKLKSSVYKGIVGTISPKVLENLAQDSFGIGNPDILITSTNLSLINDIKKLLEWLYSDFDCGATKGAREEKATVL